MYAVAPPVLGAGMVVAGIAVLRARRWPGWGRFTPITCGLYVFVVLLPAFALTGGPSFPALTAFNLCGIALGAALWTWVAAVARDAATGRAPAGGAR